MKKLRIINLYLILLGCVGIIATTLRTYALLTSFNNITMHFDNKVAITVGGALVGVLAVAFLGYLFFGEKEKELIARTDNPASYIPAGIVSAAMLFMAAERFTNKQFSYSSELVGPISTICALLAILSIGAFFLSILIQKNDNLYKAAFTLCIVFFLAFYSTYLYFNKSVHPTNSPNKVVDQMAYLFAGVFFLYEARIYLGRARWRPYVAFGLVSTLLAAYSSIPSLITYLVNGYVVSDSIIESVLTLAIGLYICSKVIQTRKLTPNAECEAAKNIKAMAAIRQDEIEAQRKLAHAHINNMVENEKTEDASNYTFDIPMAETTTDFTNEDDM